MTGRSPAATADSIMGVVGKQNIVETPSRLRISVIASMTFIVALLRWHFDGQTRGIYSEHTGDARSNTYAAPPALRPAAALPAGATTPLMRLAALRSIYAAP